MPETHCPHNVPYPDPCMKCVNDHLHAAADAPASSWIACAHGVPLTIVCEKCQTTRPGQSSSVTNVDTTTQILTERGARYGKFMDHARITQEIKYLLQDRMKGKWHDMKADQREALEMIAHKLGRIVNGDPNYEDSWRDIAGYAQLVADRLKGVTR